MSVLVQVFGSFLICCLCITMGITFAWPSSTLRLFESANTTLHRPMTDTELSLFGSLSSVGALIGTPTVGFLLDSLGRKKCAIVFSAVGVLSWGLIAASNRVEVLLTAMFVSGLSGASFLVVPVFVSEICQESIRGAMTSGTIVFYGIGMLFSYILGGILSYQQMIYACLTIIAAVTAALMMLKESPTCLMAKGLEKEAAKSIVFYRRFKPGSKEVLHELDVIRRSLNPVMEDSPPETQKMNVQSETPEKLSLFKFIKRSKSTQKAISITMVLMTASIFEGPIILQVFAQPLFEEAIPSMSANAASIILAVLGILAGFAAGYLTERAGRRPLMIYSSFIVGLSALLLGLQLHLHWGPTWLIAVNIYFFMTVYAVGAGTVPSVIMAEVFLPQVRSFISMVVIEWAWLCNSVILFIFNPLLNTIGLGPVFYIFSAVAVLCGIYCLLCMPETKGLTVDEIQLRFVSKKWRSNDF